MVMSLVMSYFVLSFFPRDVLDKIWKIAVHLAVNGDVIGDVLFCAVLFSHEMFWIRSGTELSHFLRMFLPTLKTLLRGSYLQLKSDKNMFRVTVLGYLHREGAESLSKLVLIFHRQVDHYRGGLLLERRIPADSAVVIAAKPGGTPLYRLQLGNVGLCYRIAYRRRILELWTN